MQRLRLGRQRQAVLAQHGDLQLHDSHPGDRLLEPGPLAPPAPQLTPFVHDSHQPLARPEGLLLTRVRLPGPKARPGIAVTEGPPACGHRDCVHPGPAAAALQRWRPCGQAP